MTAFFFPNDQKHRFILTCIFCSFTESKRAMGRTLIKNIDNSKETWVIVARVIKKWEVHRRTPPFPVWKLALMLMDEEV